MQFKLKKAESEILRMAAEGVSYARQFVQDVEFSPEDASRTDLDFLTKVVETVIDAGATTVNIPDTVGYTTPDEFYRIIRHLKEHVPNIGKAVISVHCHNDLGLAVANSLAAVRAGARQVEGTINGIGERAGNVALEEVIMALRTRAGQFGDVTDNINTKEIVRTSGILNCRETYEVMDPQAVGWGATELPLTKHSGRAAVKSRLEPAMGIMAMVLESSPCTPLPVTHTVILIPNAPRNMAIATSLTKGDVIRKANVTPKGMPPFTNPMNKGMEEQEQNGVMAPNRAAKKY